MVNAYKHDMAADDVPGRHHRDDLRYKRYPLCGCDGRLAFGDDRHDGALKLTPRPGRARLAFVATGGRTPDRSSMRCRRG